ncbi:hypothetical protein SUGI_0553490 [Cryptomeria japonica]|nr:hypothetical protein SUGI_0553490 [Cryptomeria japonica]
MPVLARVTMPRIGERVFYFSQSHIEQEAEQQVPLYDLPFKVLCRVMNVLPQVEQDSDEVFAHITLVPETEDDCSTDMDPPLPPPPRPSVHSFGKTLTVSETSPLGFLSVPRREADQCLAPLQSNIPSSVISSRRMQIAVLADASHAISKRTNFGVYYKSRFTGTIIQIGDSDPPRWPGSKWRCLKVQWDATSAIPQPESVSPWKIEPALTP